MLARFWLEKEPKEVVPLPKSMKCDFKNDGTRYLPKQAKLKNKKMYFDKIHIGWFRPPQNVSFHPTYVPYSKAMCDTEDIFYQQVLTNPQFIDEFF